MNELIPVKIGFDDNGKLFLFIKREKFTERQLEWLAAYWPKGQEIFTKRDGEMIRITIDK